jgi:hypothetical protein
MKIGNIYKEVISEDFKSQAKRYITQGIDPEIVKSYIDKFKYIRDKKFKEMSDELDIPVPKERRNDIDAYTDFHDLEVLVDYVGGRRPVSSSMSQGNSNEKIEVSGEAIYKDENFELYYADNPRACIKYKGKFPYSWCVARSDSSNMFYTYRFKPYEPAFYFVKDIKATEKEFGIWNMTKNVFNGEFNNKYHFFVIQVPKNANLEDVETEEYIVTSANNDGDTQMSWNKILEINPNIAPLHDLLKPKPFTPEERKQHERFKNGISDEEFAQLSYEDKRNYLDIYPTIARPITAYQLTQLPEDLLNLYVSFGIGLDDEQFAYIKNKPSILKRYTQISKKKLDEYMKRDGYERRRLKMMYSELIILSDSDIKNYLDTLSSKDINEFVLTNGEDKLELLEKHLPDKFTPESKELRTLIHKANAGDEEAISKIRAMVPDNIDVKFENDYVIIDTGNYGKHVEKNLEDDVRYLYESLEWRNWGGGYNNDYFDGNEEDLENKVNEYIEEVIKSGEITSELSSVGLTPDLETIKDLLETYDPNSIEESISQEYTGAKEAGEQDGFEKIRDKIRGIIYLDDDIVNVRVSAFSLFIITNDFFNTDNELFINNVVNLLNEILKDYDVPDGSEELHQEVDEAGWSNMNVDDAEIKRDVINSINKSIEKFNEDTGEDTGNDETPEGGQKVAKLKSQIIKSLNDTLKGLGQDPAATFIENDIVQIALDRTRFNLNGKIYAKLTDKKTGESREGYINIKDISSHFTNYKLFEQTTRIKSLIRY